MKLEVTELGPVQRAVKIEVPADDVTKRFEEAYADLNRQVRIPGFRPGRAPRSLLEQRYAKSVEEDVLRSISPDYYQRAMKEAGFTPVSVDIPPLERIRSRRACRSCLPPRWRSSRPSSFVSTKASRSSRTNDPSQTRNSTRRCR